MAKGYIIVFIVVRDRCLLLCILIKLFNDKNLCGQIGCAALDAVEKHRGATQKILEQILTRDPIL